MDQLRDYADDRLFRGCAYCGGVPETRDHVPSKVFLDQPYPENLPVIGACRWCNNGFSPDEEYLACLLESVFAGSTNPGEIRRKSVAAILERSPRLRARLEEARSLVDGSVQFSVEPERIKNIVLKLARGHAAFDLNKRCESEPTSIWWVPLSQMDRKDFEAFEAFHVVRLLGEIGSRATQRMQVLQVTLQGADGELSEEGLVIQDWVEVQEDRYKYLAVDDVEGVRVKLVLAGYLACQVFWAA